MEYNSNSEADNRIFLEVIENMNEVFLDERRDLLYYEYLASLAPTAKEREAIYSIMKEKRLFRKMYEELTGIDISNKAEETLVMSESYLSGISELIDREEIKVSRYKEIGEGFPAGSPYKYMMCNIIANKLNHITQLNSILYVNNMINNLIMNENHIDGDTDHFTLDD
ncbi:hypothetical protein [Clostridium sp. BL-8]|uniref:hypothetical protein n=1 Tax=Clostridium sp. BL-8 TaxID=349938 RepID=UPI00098C38C2|nr:hypothetical protein [Clostridium sp. BL-8]OOM75625.1 hypothetical protein CLOBL_39100 [Clostridium sp. BL-8]